MAGPSPAGAALPPRERLLAAADELFYAEGIHTVGIDRIIERAGVAKASLYSLYGSKEALVCAYLRRRHAGTLARLAVAIESKSDPRARLLAVFDAQAEVVGAPGFRGCAFTAAYAEAPPGGGVERAARAFRDAVRSLFVALAQATGTPAPEALAAQLQLLYDGVGLSVRMDGDAGVAASARAAAEALIDAHAARSE